MVPDADNEDATGNSAFVNVKNTGQDVLYKLMICAGAETKNFDVDNYGTAPSVGMSFRGK